MTYSKGTCFLKPLFSMKPGILNSCTKEKGVHLKVGALKNWNITQMSRKRLRRLLMTFDV
jgi:hypothetical protein